MRRWTVVGAAAADWRVPLLQGWLQCAPASMIMGEGDGLGRRFTGGFGGGCLLSAALLRLLRAHAGGLRGLELPSALKACGSEAF